MIIDIHTHCFPDNLAPRAIPLLAEKGGISPFTDGTVACLKNSMKKAGIDISVLLPIATKPEQTAGINRWVASVQNENIIAFGTIHPDYPDWKSEIEWLKETGIKGVKFHPDYQNFFVDDRKVYPIYEALAEAGMIMIFHAGVDLGYPAPYRCPPCRLRNVLDSFPGSLIIAAHMGGYKYTYQVEKHLVGKDIYFDTSYSFESLGNDGMENLIKHHGADRILFGTDSPWKDQQKEVSNIRSLNLKEDEKEQILGGNAARLLKLPNA